jgi:glycosyltransferase involved in cell wall biosynthesis
MLEAIAKVLKSNNLLLVCAGGKPFTVEERQFIDSLNLSDYVKHETINDLTLAELYRNAIAFIFPSLYEGFGIPILEAFSCDCPCIISNTSSLPEVAGDAAVYFNPSDQASIRESVEKMVDDPTLRSKLATRGKKRLEQFSWAKMTQETLNLYRALC